MAKLVAKGIGTVSGELFVGTAEKIPPSEIVDTTGAGDAFIGAILYGKKYIFSLVLNSNPKTVAFFHVCHQHKQSLFSLVYTVINEILMPPHF